MKKIKTFLYTIIFVPVLLLTLTCSDDIFYTISREVPLIPPLIKGSPTNFIDYNGKMYVASERSLWDYDYLNSKKWNHIKFDDHIVQLAATSYHMYMLCLVDSEKDTVRKIYQSTGVGGEDVIKLPSEAGEFNIPQSIYTVKDVLYIGTQKNDNSNEFNVIKFNVDGTGETLLPQDNNKDAILYGVASDGETTFLCTGNGIFAVENGETKGKLIDSNGFRGIITLPDDKSVVAIANNGTLSRIDNISVCKNDDCKKEFGAGILVCPVCSGVTAKKQILTRITAITDRWASGAIAIWEDKDDPSQKLLLVGRRETEYSSTSGNTNGYLEMKFYENTGSIIDYACNDCKKYFLTCDIPKDDLDVMKCPECGGALSKINNTFHEPGRGTPTTVADNERYISSIGKVPINYIYQSPVPDRVLFAATQKEGVWSYRKREGGEMWNSETQ